MTHDEVLTGVHATHDVTVHRLVRPGDQLTTSLSIVAATDIAHGAKVTTRLTTVDGDGEPASVTVDLASGAAHVYTECARIWNPIHTDRAVARAAGLPDIILHGTATLAMGVSAVVEEHAGGNPELVRRISGRFAAMVELPSTIRVNIWPANRTSDGVITVPFEVCNEHGVAAVKDGLVVLGTA